MKKNLQCVVTLVVSIVLGGFAKAQDDVVTEVNAELIKATKTVMEAAAKKDQKSFDEAFERFIVLLPEKNTIAKQEAISRVMSAGLESKLWVTPPPNTMPGISMKWDGKSITVKVDSRHWKNGKEVMIGELVNPQVRYMKVATSYGLWIGKDELGVSVWRGKLEMGNKEVFSFEEKK